MPPESLRSKLLVVDDDEDFRDTLLDWLSLAGHDVTLAADGAEALDRVTWETFDVVVTDLKMPNLDGLGMLKRLKEVAPDVPVIFLSGEATKSDVIEALREGRSFDFLEKPLPDLAHLTDAIERALSARPRRAVTVSAAAGVEDPLVAQILAYLESRLAEGISLRDVADAFGYSPAHITALVRQATGRAVMPWLVEMRIARAKRLLTETDMAVTQVAAAVGLGDPSYFSRQFRQVAGMTPMAWREAARV
jgi:YesN/AraC family two-component response regulator